MLPETFPEGVSLEFMHDNQIRGKPFDAKYLQESCPPTQYLAIPS